MINQLCHGINIARSILYTINQSHGSWIELFISQMTGLMGSPNAMLHTKTVFEMAGILNYLQVPHLSFFVSTKLESQR
jgi:hypothetical protein